MWSELLPGPMAKPRDGGGLDQATLERLFVKLEKPMFNVVYRWLWNASDAEEVTQEAFLRVWRARDGVDLATVEPLLYRTALNLASNRRRSARLWRFIGFEAAGDPPSRAKVSDEVLAEEETRACVRRAIDALPEHLRRVIVLSEYAELTQPEVGAALGIPTGTVGSRRHAALEMLAASLCDLEEAK